MSMKKNTVTKLPITAAVEEGPYYKTGSPERRSIAEPGTAGSKLIMKGLVLDKDGRPVVHAWLDFWHADGHGQYDNVGFNLRGHQYTDKDGSYYLETVRPYEYMMRAAHVHVKVRATPKSPVLTTQLFFPGEARNATDPLFEKLTVMNVQDTEGGQQAAFYFVVETE